MSYIETAYSCQIYLYLEHHPSNDSRRDGLCAKKIHGPRPAQAYLSGSLLCMRLSGYVIGLFTCDHLPSPAIFFAGHLLVCHSEGLGVEKWSLDRRKPTGAERFNGWNVLKSIASLGIRSAIRPQKTPTVWGFL